MRRLAMVCAVVLVATGCADTTAPVTVATVALSPSSVTLEVGATQQLTATLYDAGGAAFTGRTVTWISSATTVATVSGTGLVTAVAGGTSVITATCEGKRATATVTVTVSAWTGTWNLVSVNGYTLPASISILGYATRVVRRTLDVWRGGQGIWNDSTLSALVCGPGSAPGVMCNASGAAAFSWSATGLTLTFVRNSGTTVGYVVAVKTFVMQADGSLLKTDDSQTEVYRR